MGPMEYLRILRRRWWVLLLATLLGFLISTLAFVAIPVVIVLRILGSYLPGFSALTILVLLLGGIELIAIGIIVVAALAACTPCVLFTPAMTAT